MNQKNAGFTIIEVTTVIVIIGILATIGTFAYLNVQKNARDNARVANAEAITQAVELYTRDKETFPPQQGSGTWEESSVQGNNFLTVLYTDGYLRGDKLVDPTNSTTYQYKYGVFDPTIPAEQNHCETDRGPYFVLGVTQMESLGETGGVPNPSPESPGWKCGSGAASTDWQTEFGWVTGGYLDEFITTP